MNPEITKRFNSQAVVEGVCLGIFAVSNSYKWEHEGFYETVSRGIDPHTGRFLTVKVRKPIGKVSGQTEVREMDWLEARGYLNDVRQVYGTRTNFPHEFSSWVASVEKSLAVLKQEGKVAIKARTKVYRSARISL